MFHDTLSADHKDVPRSPPARWDVLVQETSWPAAGSTRTSHQSRDSTHAIQSEEMNWSTNDSLPLAAADETIAASLPSLLSSKGAAFSASQGKIAPSSERSWLSATGATKMETEQNTLFRYFYPLLGRNKSRRS